SPLPTHKPSNLGHSLGAAAPAAPRYRNAHTPDTRNARLDRHLPSVSSPQEHHTRNSSCLRLESSSPFFPFSLFFYWKIFRINRQKGHSVRFNKRFLLRQTRGLPP